MLACIWLANSVLCWMKFWWSKSWEVKLFCQTTLRWFAGAATGHRTVTIQIMKGLLFFTQGLKLVWTRPQRKGSQFFDYQIHTLTSDEHFVLHFSTEHFEVCPHHCPGTASAPLHVSLPPLRCAYRSPARPYLIRFPTLRCCFYHSHSHYAHQWGFSTTHI